MLLMIITIVSVAQAGPIMGKLRTRDNKSVRMNGTDAMSGSTVFSGASIQCPAKVGATVDLGALGRVDIAPNSELVLNFSEGSINITLKSGYLVLTTKDGVKGTVATPDGQVAVTDPAKGTSLIARTAGSEGPEAAAAAGAKTGSGGLKAVVGIGVAGAAVVGGSAAGRSNDRGQGVSPNKP